MKVSADFTFIRLWNPVSILLALLDQSIKLFTGSSLVARWRHLKDQSSPPPSQGRDIFSEVFVAGIDDHLGARLQDLLGLFKKTIHIKCRN